MRFVIAAVGQRLPGWAADAFDDYARRFPAECRMELKAVKAEPREGGRSVAQMKAAEAARLRAACPPGAWRVALDERGTAVSTAALALRFEAWRTAGRDCAFFVGGPDGLCPTLLAEADERLRLSDLTLPHALARVLLAEALYRAWSVAAHHPYHRD
jgi:23S rRNA (pseudouridine1915-N3)-methyltransferase